MSTKYQKLSPEEIKNMVNSLESDIRVIMGTKEAAKFLKIKLATLYCWVCYGHLEGTYRKRGKYLNFLTSRLVDKFYNGKDWRYPYRCKK